MKILLTGGSSFTGAWFARTLAERGHDVVMVLRGSPNKYDLSRRRRFDWVAPMVRVVETAPFGSERFISCIRSEGPFDVLCHHAAEATNYRSFDFDALTATGHNTRELVSTLKALRETNSRACVVATGSAFEADEGMGSTSEAFSPYGLSKSLTWQMQRYYCQALGVPLRKFVIPNPFGPYEEARFTSYLIRRWKEGKVAVVKTPDYVRDNIHIDLLSHCYAQFVGRDVSIHGNSKFAPSGYIESQGSFARRFAEEMQARLAHACPVELATQTDFGEPMIRVNTTPAKPMVENWREEEAWERVASFYR